MKFNETIDGELRILNLAFNTLTELKSMLPIPLPETVISPSKVEHAFNWEIPVASVMEVLENEHLFDESAAETDVNKAATIGKKMT